jgi:hypothetical protein
VSSRRTIEQFFLNGVLVEPGDRAQAAGHGRTRPAPGLEVSREALDVSTARLEEAKVALLAPSGELAQVQLVSLARQAGIAGQEPR